MQMNPVDGSTVIASHGHDPSTGKMRVTLKSGKTYEYDDVPLEKYAAFTGAKSMGAYWNQKIKAHHNGREIKEQS